MPIKFCHIAPTAFLPIFTKTNGAHLLLAHLVEEDAEYRKFYANLRDGKPKILDNSAFEMYKRNLPMFDPEKLINLGKLVKADYLVLTDYPGEPGSKTIKMAQHQIPLFKKNGFKTFFVPQSSIGDESDYIRCFQWGLHNRLVDLVGLSILGIPNAYGVEKNNKLQRYNARAHFLSRIEDMLDPILDVGRFHCLGMVDGPNEIELLRRWHRYIYSWDSSSAVWAGLNDIRYDNSPTGLVNGKFELDVDFSHNKASEEQIANVTRNIQHIKRML